jgi:hypothetical protein
MDLRLFRIRPFRIALVTGTVTRATSGTIPFLLLLLLQLGFGLNPLQSGWLTFTSVLAAVFLKPAGQPLLRLKVMIAGTAMWSVCDAMVGIMDRHSVHAKRGALHHTAQQQLELRSAMEMWFGDKTLDLGPRGLGTTICTIEDQLAVHTLALAAIDVGPGYLLEIRHYIVIWDTFLHGSSLDVKCCSRSELPRHRQ